MLQEMEKSKTLIEPEIMESESLDTTVPPESSGTSVDGVNGAKQAVNAKLEEINALISPYKLAYVHPVKDCILLDRNARYMTKEQQARLDENIKRDGFLSQLPFGILQEDGKYKIISGNHRIKSAINAKLQSVLILYGDESDFDEQRQLAIQLSHNSIAGQDDPFLLKELYMELDDLFLKAYSGIDERELLSYKPLDLSAIAERDIELSEIRFMFCEPDKAKIERLMDMLDRKLGLDAEKDSLVFADRDWFIDIMSDVQKKYQIKNKTAAFLKMCSIVEDHLAE